LTRWPAGDRLVGVRVVMYEYPLACLLGIEGIALLRSFTGQFDRSFTEARLAEIRCLLADPSLAAVHVQRVDTIEGYRRWSQTCDSQPNSAFELDEPVVREILSGLPVGVALDAACGTGRYSAWLAELGHRQPVPPDW
jgi:hypothetical protein